MQRHEQAQGQEECHHDEPRVGVDGLLQHGCEHAHAGDQGGQAQLHGQQAVHLAEEAHPDVLGGPCHVVSVREVLLHAVLQSAALHVLPLNVGHERNRRRHLGSSRGSFQSS